MHTHFQLESSPPLFSCCLSPVDRIHQKFPSSYRLKFYILSSAHLKTLLQSSTKLVAQKRENWFNLKILEFFLRIRPFPISSLETITLNFKCKHKRDPTTVKIPIEFVKRIEKLGSTCSRTSVCTLPSDFLEKEKRFRVVLFGRENFSFKGLGAEIFDTWKLSGCSIPIDYMRTLESKTIAMKVLEKF